MCKWTCACTDLVCGIPGPAVWMLFGSLPLPDHALRWSFCGQTPAAGNAILSAFHSNQSFTPVFQPSESAWPCTIIWKEWMKASVLCWHLWIHHRVLRLDGRSCLAQLVADVGNFCGSEAVNGQNQNETSELKPRYETQTEHDKRLKWHTHPHTHSSCWPVADTLETKLWQDLLHHCGDKSFCFSVWHIKFILEFTWSKCSAVNDVNVMRAIKLT